MVRVRYIVCKTKLMHSNWVELQQNRKNVVNQAKKKVKKIGFISG